MSAGRPHALFSLKLTMDFQQVLTADNMNSISMWTRSPVLRSTIYVLCDPGLEILTGGRLMLEQVEIQSTDMPTLNQTTEIEISYFKTDLKILPMYLLRRVRGLLRTLHYRGFLHDDQTWDLYWDEARRTLVLNFNYKVELTRKAAIRLLLNGHREPNSELTLAAQWRPMWF